jgi:hypothetical protein
VIALNGDILLDFDVVDALEDSESMSDTRDAHLFQIIVLQCYKSFADNLVFY